MRLIDADALKEAFDDYDTDVCQEYPDYYALWGFSRDAVDEAIDKAPTIEAEPVRHGRWVLKNTDGTHTEAFHCSECDKVPRSHYPEEFCPNCGAKMDKED